MKRTLLNVAAFEVEGNALRAKESLQNWKMKGNVLSSRASTGKCSQADILVSAHHDSLWTSD